jgi:methionyl-tRNA formyltransferase
MAMGARLMVEALASVESGHIKLTPQASVGVTYAAKIDKAETRIDWTPPAQKVHNRIRGLSPSPGAWCEMEIGGKVERVKLLRSSLAQGRGAPGSMLDDRLQIACGQGSLRLLELQRAGGKTVTSAEFLRGANVARIV